MQSNTFDKSIRKASNALTLSIHSLNFSVITTRLCWELYPFTKSTLAKKKVDHWNIYKVNFK